MGLYEQITSSQRKWAQARGIELVSSVWNEGLPDQQQDLRGKKNYARRLEDNLFEPLLPQTRREFEEADGSELAAANGMPKMHALHSTAALVVNVFQYWRDRNPAAIAEACGLPPAGIGGFRFEAKFRILNCGGTPPNVDCCFDYGSNGPIRAAAIEAKFCEPWGRRKRGGFLPAHFVKAAALWKDLLAMWELAHAINDNPAIFEYLDAAQLIKHVLGLKTQTGGKGNFRLLYLWHACRKDERHIDASDSFPMQECCEKHQAEIDAFKKIADADGIQFSAMTYQKVLSVLDEQFREEHGQYVRYLLDRYF